VPEAGSGPLGALLERARELALDVRSLAFASAEPAADICRTAEAKQASLVLLGWHKPLLLEGRLGGIVGEVIAQTSTPVGVLVDRGLADVRRILVAYAGGPEDLEALRLARRLGHAPGAELTLLHVVAPGNASRPGKGRSQIDQELQVFAQPDLDSQSLAVRVVEHVSAPDAVLKEAQRGYDLIILGMNATWGLSAGRISLKRQRVLAESPVSVLAIHPPVAALRRAAEAEGYVSALAESSSSG
jgi:nucleotide-binding universal stress UspA family protein